MASITQRNTEATVFVGELHTAVNEEILFELFVQVGPVVNVHIPKDKVTGQHQGFGFVEFETEADAAYAINVLGGVRVYGQPLRINYAAKDKRSFDVGANLFIGNLGDTDEKAIYDTFSRFGHIVQPPKVMREPDGASRGFAFLGYDSFEASDAAIASMNGQFLNGRPINVSYAVKRDSKSNERHGSEAERLLAAQRRNAQFGGR